MPTISVSIPAHILARLDAVTIKRGLTHKSGNPRRSAAIVGAIIKDLDAEPDVDLRLCPECALIPAHHGHCEGPDRCACRCMADREVAGKPQPWDLGLNGKCYREVRTDAA